MKHLKAAALALALVGGTSALAQPPESSGHHGGQAPSRPAPQAAAPRPAPQAAPAAPRGPQGGAQGYQGGGRPGGSQGGGYQGAPTSGGTRGGAGGYPGYSGGSHGAQNAPAAQGGRGGYQGYQGNSGAGRPGQGAGQGYQGGAHGGRGVPSTYSPRFGAPGFRPGPGAARPHYNAQYFPRVFRPDRQYAWRGGAWSGPPGYYYRRWGYGDRLPYGWFAAQWFINDYYYYDLAVPPYGYEWVRVGPDALLVDTDDGTVVESVYGIFY